jgi:hypothetical protein
MNMEPEDGCLALVDINDEVTVVFTARGIENLQELLDDLDGTWGALLIRTHPGQRLRTVSFGERLPIGPLAGDTKPRAWSGPILTWVRNCFCGAVGAASRILCVACSICCIHNVVGRLQNDLEEPPTGRGNA